MVHCCCCIFHGSTGLNKSMTCTGYSPWGYKEHNWATTHTHTQHVSIKKKNHSDSNQRNVHFPQNFRLLWAPIFPLSVCHMIACSTMKCLLSKSKEKGKIYLHSPNTGKFLSCFSFSELIAQLPLLEFGLPWTQIKTQTVAWYCQLGSTSNSGFIH